MSKKLLFRLAALVVAMMCALGASAAEAYACYTSSNTTLTFYYDDQRSSRQGTTYLLFSGFPGWYDIRTSVTQVVFDPTFADARPSSANYWFYEMTNLTTISGLNYLNTENMISMNGMFAYCSSLTSIDVGHFNTDNSENMGGMFYGCSGVSTLDVSHFNTSKVTNMYGMFQNCSGLNTLDVSHFNTSKVTNMGAMFQNCSGLTMLDLGSFNINKIQNMSYMFSGCSNLTTIYVGGGWFVSTSNFDGSYIFTGCTNLVGGHGTHYNNNNPTMDSNYAVADNPSAGMPGYMTGKCYVIYNPDNTTLTFYYDYLANTRQGIVYYPIWYPFSPDWYRDLTAKSVTQVVFDPSFAEVRPTSTLGWFYGMNQLSSVSGMEYLNTEDVTNMENMFNGCSALTSLDLSTFSTPNLQIMNKMFYGCYNLTTIYASDLWTTQSDTYGTEVFYGCGKLVGDKGTTYSSIYEDYVYAHLDGGPSDPGYFSEVPQPQAYACYTPSNTTLTFYYDDQRNSREGTTYDLNTGFINPGWIIDGTNANVTKVVFDPSFADVRPTSTYTWFYLMRNLQSITGISYLNTSQVTNMGYMFKSCSSLTSLDLTHFNTESLISMNEMFYYCIGLTELDLSSFNTANVVNMEYMFGEAYNLTRIVVGDEWSTTAVTNSEGMFNRCNNLVGSMGTTYDANHTDKTYAHIDGGPSNPGYLSGKTEAYAVYTAENTTLTFYCDNQRNSRPGTTYDIFPRAGWTNKNLAVRYVVFDQSFELAKPTSTSSWFSEMGSLESITGIRYLKTDSVTDMSYMFFECGLSDLEMNNYLSYFNTAKVKRMEWMFHSCKALTTLDLTNFNTANVTDMSYMFDGCNDLTTIYVGDGWSNESVTNSEKMFMYCLSLVGGQGTTFDYDHVDGSYAHIDGGPDNPGYFTAKAEAEAYAVYTEDNTTLTFYYDDQRGSRPGTTTYGLNLGSEGMEWHETPYFFTHVVFDPSFADVRPTTTSRWFEGMSNVRSISGLEYLNTDSVTDMSSMFFGCFRLTSVDLSHFNTSKVTSMYFMFANCRALTSLDLSSFNTDNVTTMECMFLYCMGLKSVDLSGFTNARVQRTCNMFESCYALTTIYADSGWSLPANNYSYAMFIDCTSLVGGKGTTYDANHVDDEYAHIDGGPSNPGYFTGKVDFLRGDVNGDNNVSIGDVTTLIDYLLSGDASGINLAAADCNQDTGVSIGDVTALIDFLLAGSW